MVELEGFLSDELTQLEVAREALEKATLMVAISLSEIPWADRGSREVFYKNGEVFHGSRMHRCVMECESEILLLGESFRSSKTDIHQWPVGWP